MQMDHATEADYNYIAERDKHLAERLIMSKIANKEICILRNPEGE